MLNINERVKHLAAFCNIIHIGLKIDKRELKFIKNDLKLHGKVKIIR